MSGGTRRAAAILLIALALVPFQAAPENHGITVFAAASTSPALNEVEQMFSGADRSRVRSVFASSASLARQIAAGAPADVFLSANGRWMDFLGARRAIEPASRTGLLTNRLVLVAPADSSLFIALEPGFSLARALGGGLLAMGDPDHVPAGIYGKEALSSLGIWPSVAPRVARAADTLAALALVARGEVAAGIVYASDARISDRVRVVAVFSADAHTPIAYPLAIVAGRCRASVVRFYNFLRSDRAAAVFVRHGFAAIPRATGPRATDGKPPCGP